jgi:ERCC4-type nuclease
MSKRGPRRITVTGASTTKSTLIIDARERAVTCHEAELATIQHTIAQITIGDYVVRGPAGTILAVIERKSYEDFAASLKDGRHNNKEKMIKLREETGCRIVYIVEGRLNIAPNDPVGKMPFRYIESSIFHLMVRDGICVLRTANTLDTAQTLCRFVHSMDTLCDKWDPTALEDAKCDVVAQPASLESTLALLTVKHEKSDHDYVRDMWACFRGVTVDTADNYIQLWSISDIICGRVNNINSTKLSSGRVINKAAAKGISSHTPSQHISMLACVPGVSKQTASAIICTETLAKLLKYTEGDLADFVPGAKKRLGAKISSRILLLFNYKRPSQSEQASAESLNGGSLAAPCEPIVESAPVAQQEHAPVAQQESAPVAQQEHAPIEFTLDDIRDLLDNL